MIQIEIEANGLRVGGALDEWGLVLRCEGIIDVCNVSALRTLFAVAIRLQSPQVHLDLRQVFFFDARLIWLLLEALAAMVEGNEDAVLTLQVRPDQLPVFRLTGADRVLRFTCCEPSGANHCDLIP